MYTKSVKITNKEAKNILNNKPVIWVDDSSINAYTNGTNFYNAGVYGDNFPVRYAKIFQLHNITVKRVYLSSQLQ